MSSVVEGPLVDVAVVTPVCTPVVVVVSLVVMGMKVVATEPVGGWVVADKEEHFAPSARSTSISSLLSVTAKQFPWLR